MMKAPVWYEMAVNFLPDHTVSCPRRQQPNRICNYLQQAEVSQSDHTFPLHTFSWIPYYVRELEKVDENAMAQRAKRQLNAHYIQPERVWLFQTKAILTW
jgi:hypothetical protein